jgi:hypothetical protein
MNLARISLSLAGIVGTLTVAFSGALIWLLVTQPVSTTEKVANGEISPLVRSVADVLYQALQGLLKYL